MNRRPLFFLAAYRVPSSVFDAEVLAHMFGDDIEEELDEPGAIVQARIIDRFLQ
jgi:hypothetical protein